MSLALALALLVPAAAVTAALLSLPRGFDPVVSVRLGAAGAAAAWLPVLLVAGPGDDLVATGRFAADGPAAAAGFGAALLIAAASLTGRSEAIAGGGALLAVTAGVSAATGAGHGGDLLAGLVLGAAIATVPSVAARRWTVPPVAASAGLALVAVGLVRHHDERSTLRLVAAAGTSWTAAAALVVGALLLVWAGTRGRRGPGAVFLPAGLLVTAKVAELLDGHDAIDLGPLDLDLRRLAGLLVGVAGLLVAVRVPAWFPWSRLRRVRADPVTALALWSVAVLVFVPVLAPGLLLAAAAVLTAAGGVGALVAAAMPAGVVLAVELTEAGSAESAAFGGLAIATAVALAAAVAPVGRARTRQLRAAGRDAATGSVDEVPPALAWLPEPRAATGVAVLLAGWLVIAPGTWGWVGEPTFSPFSSWHRAALVAVPVALVSIGLAGWRGLLSSPAGFAPLTAGVPQDHAGAGRKAMLIASAGLGASLAWLLLSVTLAG